jgi:hypothetical protein
MATLSYTLRGLRDEHLEMRRMYWMQRDARTKSEVEKREARRALAAIEAERDRRRIERAGGTQP